MAAQMRCMVPSASHRHGLHIRGLAHNNVPCVSNFYNPGSTAKHLHFYSVYAASPSTTIASASSYGTGVNEDGRDGEEFSENDGSNRGGSFNGHGGSGGGGGDDSYQQGGQSDGDSLGKGGSFLGALLKGWNDRVSADPQFPFKVLMEEIVGVGACVIGDMASRPNFGLNELDFVFSTIVVGSILNFALMYMLAPTSAVAASSASRLPFIFSSCPPGHMFEQGAYSVFDRFGTFVYKGAVFAAVGFGAGLFGTFMSNRLIGMRKKMDPSFEPQNKAPPTILNAGTWALHMGLSSNLRYQLINGMEFAMANVLSPPVFKVSVLGIRAMNNVLGGVSFVTLARLTGSQKAEGTDVETASSSVNEPKLSMTSMDTLVTTDGDMKSDTGVSPPKEGDTSR